jgi:hypothetical protein
VTFTGDWDVGGFGNYYSAYIVSLDSRAKASLVVSARFCMIHPTLSPHLLPFCPRLWPPCCSLNLPGTFLPQGLCTSCFPPPSLECSPSRTPHGSLPPLRFRVLFICHFLSEMSPSLPSLLKISVSQHSRSFLPSVFPGTLVGMRDISIHLVSCLPC